MKDTLPIKGLTHRKQEDTWEIRETIIFWKLCFFLFSLRPCEETFFRNVSVESNHIDIKLYIPNIYVVGLFVYLFLETLVLCFLTIDITSDC